MKIRYIIAVLALSILAGATAPGQSPMSPYGQPNVLSKTQAQAQTKAQLQQAQIQYISLLEKGFDQLSNIVTANPYHLSQSDVIAGFGDQFAGQVQQNGALMLSTIIKANIIIGRTDNWLAQDWVQAWISAYKLDPATGDPVK